MQEFTLSQAAEWTNGRASVDAVITNVVRDAREAGPGSLFIALAGERFDGHDFIGQAIERGAAAVMTHRADETYPVPALYVADTRQGLLDLAGGYRAQFDCPVVAVTGSVGKTTTKEMIAAVLSERYDTLKTEGNYNNTVGMPLTALRMDENTEAAVFEMGMSAFGEIASMAACGQPNLAVITMIGTSHIEFLGSREGICKAKLEILEGLRPDGTAVLCGDEPLLWDKRESLGVKTVYFGIENPACDVRAEHIMLSDDCVRFTITAFGRRFPAEIHTAGRHNVYNALAAAAVGAVLGLSDREIADGLASFTDLHQSIYRKDGYMIIDACYNASPDSVEASLDVLHELDVTGRRFAVLGGMRELGAYQDEGHLRCGRRAAACADVLYALGDGAEQYRDGAREAGMPDDAIRLFSSPEEMAQALRENAQPGDALLFKGSRYWAMEKVLAGFFSAQENSDRK